MAQTSYSISPARAFAGLISDVGTNYVISRTNEESVSVEFGLMVAAGTDPEAQFLNCAALTDVLLGVTTHQHTQDRDGVEAGDTAGLISRGGVWVVVEEAVVPGDGVFVRCVVTGGEQYGAFRTDADGTDAVEITNARWISSTAGAGLALLDLNMP